MGRIGRGIGVAFAVLVSLAVMVTVPAAVLDATLVRGQSDCPLGFEFERTGAKVVERRAFPPRVECRYEYESGVDGAAIYPPSTQVYDALPSTLVAGAAMALAAVTGAVGVRLGRRRPAVADAVAVPVDGPPAAAG